MVMGTCDDLSDRSHQMKTGRYEIHINRKKNVIKIKKPLSLNKKRFFISVIRLFLF